jgi:tripeptidyl-peptidase I
MPKFFIVLFLICVLVTQSQSEIAALFVNNSAAKDRRVDVERLSTLTHAYKESIPRFTDRDDVYRGRRIHNSLEHEVVFVIQPSNMEELTRILHDVSDPMSRNYGHHLSKSEIDEMTSNVASRNILESYLARIGALVTSETLGGEYVTASAAISVWEKMFDTEFFTFHQTQQDGRINRIVRAEKYSIPRELEPHVESVFNTIQIPPQYYGNHTNQKIIAHDNVGSAYNFPGYTTPARVREAYNMGTSKGSVKSTQGVFAAASQYYSPSDVSFFLSYFDGVSHPVYKSIGNHSSDRLCSDDTSSCDEANLDLEYIMSMSAQSPTTFWYTDQSFSRWLTLVANMAEPPMVMSISYGTEESYLSASEMSAFNTQAIKLSAMGVTLVAASGDDGAISRRVRTSGQSACGYSSLFPASCPYVTAVGGTSVSTAPPI